MAAHIRCGRNVLRGLIKPQRCSDSITHPLLFASQGLRYRKLEVILTTLHQPEEVETVVKVVPNTKENKMKEYQTAAKRLDNARLFHIQARWQTRAFYAQSIKGRCALNHRSLSGLQLVKNLPKMKVVDKAISHGRKVEIGRSKFDMG